MNEFSQKADLLVQLKHFGDQYLNGVRTEFGDRDRTTWDNFTVNELFLDERLKRLGEFVISDVAPTAVRLPHIRAMNEPVFTWNMNVGDPTIRAADNKILNSSDCFPPSLTILAMDYIEQGYGSGHAIYDDFVKKVGALFLCAATPRDFQADAGRNGVALHFADHTQSPITEFGHVGSGRLLYRIISQGGLPAFDIHDITQHASQMGAYADFYTWLTKHGSDEVMQPMPKHLRQRRLIRSVLLTTLEHSVVAAEDGVQSFGCLNWQAPRKSILAAGVSKRSEFRVNDYVFGAQDINRWSAVRAVASIYREQLEAEELLGVRLDWMEAMGYSMHPELLSRIRPFSSYDYSDLTFDSARKARLIVPSSPEELFGNCKQLVAREFGSDAAI